MKLIESSQLVSELFIDILCKCTSIKLKQPVNPLLSKLSLYFSNREPKPLKIIFKFLVHLLKTHEHFLLIGLFLILNPYYSN